MGLIPFEGIHCKLTLCCNGTEKNTFMNKMVFQHVLAHLHVLSKSGVLVIFGFSVLNKISKKPKNQIGNLVFPFFCFQKNQKTEFGNLVFPFFCFKHKIKKTEFQKNQKTKLEIWFFCFSKIKKTKKQNLEI